jgi:hypothetical protein
MSDFGELCPLFNTGVFNEITFPVIVSTASSDTVNLLEGLSTAGALAGKDNFTFGRTVVVTNAFIRKWTANLEIMYMHLKHYTSAGATPTAFGTWTISNTYTLEEVKYHWKAVTHTDKTFTSDEVLGLSVSCGTTSSGGEYDLIVQYKEK